VRSTAGEFAFRMKTFRIYSNSQKIQEMEPIFIEDGFSLRAMIFNFLWFLYYSLWIELLVFIVLQCVLSLVDTYLGYKIYLALQLFIYLAIGFFANQIRAYSLERQGYKFRDIIIAKNEEKAKLKFYKNFLDKDYARD